MGHSHGLVSSLTCLEPGETMRAQAGKVRLSDGSTVV